MTRAGHFGSSFFFFDFHSSLLWLLGFLTPCTLAPLPQLSSHVFCWQNSKAGTSQSRQTCTQEGPIAPTHNVNAGNSSTVTCGVVICCQRRFRRRCFHHLFITWGVCPLCFCVGVKPPPHSLSHFVPFGQGSSNCKVPVCLKISTVLFNKKMFYC